MTPSLQRKLLALGALLVAGGALAFVSLGTLGEDIVYYWSPTEVSAKADAAQRSTIRLGGLVEAGTLNWNPESQRLAFRLTDGKTSIPVVGQGAPPQMFREGIGAVVEGKLGKDGVFNTTNIIVKHGNEYKAPTEGEKPEVMYQALMQEGA
jgi:cytochrome c-type biogenesis protein CcmE